MVNFMFIPLTDPKLTPELKARFVNVGQLIKWELTGPSGVYTGLVVVRKTSSTRLSIDDGDYLRYS